MTLLALRGLAVHYATARGTLRAVDGVDLDIARGETVGLVGESGCGKSTLGKALLGLAPVTAGAVRFDGVDLARLGTRARAPYRRRMQMIFQDPFGSLNPRHTIGAILEAPHRSVCRRTRSRAIRTNSPAASASASASPARWPCSRS
jgi:ABC-type glutathione transport system ATPase component